MDNKIVFLIIVLFLSSISFAQAPPAPAPPPAAAAAPPPAAAAAPPANSSAPKSFSWTSMKALPAEKPFVSLEGRFTLALPPDIQGFAALSPKQLGINATGMQFTWKFQEGDALLIFVDFPEAELKGTAEDLQKVSSNLTAAFLKSFPQGKAIDSETFKSGDIPGSQTNFDLGENKFGIQRIYLVKNRVYRALAFYQNAENGKFLNQAFDSFKLISEAEVAAALQKKFEALKPPALPQQAPIVAKEKTDAQDENLKGKIKKVVAESEDLSGTWSVQGRKMSSVTYFNEKGNYIQRDSYDSQGNPFQITMYGYIDGKRVSNSKITNYEYSPPVAAAPQSKSAETAKKPDPRYEYAFEYKYKDGKLAEKQMYFSSGKKGMRYVYNYDGNQVEELVYTTEGTLNQKYLVTLDENGSEIEKVNYGISKVYPDRKYRYTYEYDDQGNWIKKITSTEKNENGTSAFVPTSVSYRTITYY